MLALICAAVVAGAAILLLLAALLLGARRQSRDIEILDRLTTAQGKVTRRNYRAIHGRNPPGWNTGAVVAIDLPKSSESEDLP